MIILRCTNDNNVVQDIQIQEQIDLRLDISAIENATIGDVYGISSQEFAIPGTNETNQFFGNLYNLGATPSVALQNSIDCQVLLNGAEVFKGKLYIKNIITDSDGNNALYNVIVVNETVDFKFEIQDTYINQLDFSKFNHDFTYANVSQSWGGGLLGGAVIYPFVNYGIVEGTFGADYAFAAFNSTGSNTIDNAATPLELTAFKPAIRAKDVVDTIFSGSSYDYTSSFFNSTYFEDLYVLTTPNDTLGPNNTSPVSQSAWAYNESGSQTILAGNLAKIEFDAEVIDNGNNFSLVNDRYIADTAGFYQYQISINYLTLAWAPSNNNTVQIQLRKNGASIIDTQFYYNIPATGSAFLQGTVQMDPADYLEVEMIPQGKNITIRNEVGKPSYLPAGYQTYFQVKGPASQLGANVDMAEQFPDDLKALDFLQGLIEKFNLVVEPVPNSRNLIRIEPYQDWINAGVSKDWTNKVDRSSRFEITHPVTEQPRTIIFSDEDDTDILNEYTLETKGATYGSYTFTSDSDLAEGERRIGKIFAATPVTGIPNGRQFVIPHLCTVTDNREFRPIKFKPRLLYNNGLQTVPDTALGIQTGSIDRGTIFVRDENAVSQPTKIWNQMNTLTSIPVDFTTGQDLHFNNDLYTPYFQSSANGKTKADAYRTYWATYINGLYDFDARKLTCNIYLKPSEIQNIALNDKLFIDGAYYRINRINGANLTRRDTVEVELIKILTAQFKFPKRRIFTAPGDYISVVSDYELLSINGTGRYINVDTGATIEDFNQLRQVASKDGFQLYNNAGTGSIVWDYQLPVEPLNQLSQQVLGTNKVGTGASKVTALGNDNEVKQGSETSFVVGSNNLVAENTSNITTIGQSHTVEAAVSNAQILGGVSNTISSSRESVIIGGTGSLFVNNDWVIDINGYNGAVRDSDNTTAINRADQEVIINGSGHTVINLNLEGGGLDLLNTRNNSAWLGDTYFGESIFVDSITKTVGDGTRIDLTGSLQGQGRHESLYILNWAGLSPGTANIGLPSAANNDYKGVVYTFKGSNFATGDSVVITPFAGFGQTIDGNATYTLSGVSSSAPWVTLHASGGDWYVINEFSAGGGGGFTPSFSGSFSGSFTGSLLGTASYALCSEDIKTTNWDQPDPGQIFYYTSVLNTGSDCKDVNTLDSFGLHYESNTNTHYLDTPLVVTGSITATSFTGSIPNIYTADGTLDNNRTIDLGGNTLIFSASSGETFEIASNPASDVLISGLPQATTSNVVYYNTTNGKLTYGAAASGSGAAFPYTGSASITGSLNVTGSVRGNVVSMSISSNTASLDLSKGNAFEITLTTGSATLITASNIVPNQHISLLVNQSASSIPVNGNLFFDNSFFFGSGSNNGFVPTTTASKHLYTFETFTFNPPVLANASVTYNLLSASGAPSPAALVDFIVVAGGGGGGSHEDNDKGGGGGGAGGVVTGSAFQVVSGVSYTVTVGAGGAGGSAPTNKGATGGNSLFSSSIFTGLGGGGGAVGAAGQGGAIHAGNNGGSGGGGTKFGTVSVGLQPTSSFGGFGSNGGTATNDGGAGGGGATAVGLDTTTANGASGGAGITWVNGIVYAGGGGGGAYSGTGGAGGTGGGGAGGNPNANGVAGSDGFGGGGGGAGGGNNAARAGADGGDGTVIVRYNTGDLTATGGTITTTGSFTYHTFTGSGTFSVS